MISNQTHTSNTTELAETKQHKFHVKDPGSALTHFIAMIGAAIAAVPLLHKAAEEADSRHLAALAVFIISMILLYAASTTYHTFNISEHVNKILRKIDHMMIFILIAGTYTPVCLIVLENNAGYRLLALVWGIAIAGIRHRGHHHQRPLDQLPEVVFFAGLHRDGLDLCAGLPADRAGTSEKRLSLAADRRAYLHGGRHYLRTETADFQCKA